MSARPSKTGYFLLEALNSLGTTYYFYYIYFFTEKQFQFAKLQNLLLAAALGLTYGVSSIIGGRFAQRRGCFAALKAGYAIMAVVIGSGALHHSLALHLAIMFAGTFGMALTWPALEAIVSEGETGARLRRHLGIYNLVWSGFGAVAYFTGGTIIDAAGFRFLFLLAAAIQAAQLFLVVNLERFAVARVGDITGPLNRSAANELASRYPSADEVDYEDDLARRRSPVAPRAFLRIAWLANPFGYLAINTVIAVIPMLAKRLGLTVVQAGIVGSLWLFVRAGSFLLLWLWPGWHYRFRWLAGAYAFMTVSFVAMLLAPNIGILTGAEIVFGLALGLIYYSSLYYSMEVGDTKGEHGGFHEAMIGAGSCAGPAIGALGLYWFPDAAGISTWMPAGLMVVGFSGLMCLRFRGRLTMR